MDASDLAALDRRTQRLAAVNRATHALAESGGVEMVARKGLDSLLELAGLDAGEIFRWDADRRAFVHLLHGGVRPDALSEPSVLHEADGLLRFATGRPTSLVMDAEDDQALILRRALPAAGLQTFVALSLQVEDQIAGVAVLAAYERHAVDGEMLEVLEGLARQVAIALDRAQALVREQTLRRRLEALNEAVLSIAAELSLPALLQRITDIARDLTNARYAALGVAGPDRRLTSFITSGISEEDRAGIGHPPEGRGLLGLILSGASPVRVAVINSHPQSSGFPANHPPMTTFLGAPIVLGGRNLGNLYLTDRQDGLPFTDSDERLIVQLAAHAAIAIENARRYGRASATLEQQVAELDEANRQLARLSSLALHAQEEERRRLARELHDDTAQALASLMVRLRLLERADPAELGQRVVEFLAVLARALDEVRRMAYDLRPSMLDDLGLTPALETHLREVAGRSGLQVHFRSSGLDVRLPNEVELVVYRIVQEALSNAVKHAQASEASVELCLTGRTLDVLVIDNGHGFDVAATLASRERGLGLFGMQERATLVGGELNVISQVDAGTRVQATITLRDEFLSDDDFTDDEYGTG